MFWLTAESTRQLRAGLRRRLAPARYEARRDVAYVQGRSSRASQGVGGRLLRCSACLVVGWSMAACSGADEDSGAADTKTLVATLEAQDAAVEVADVFASEIGGLYGVELGGGNFVYGTPDGRHIVAGDLFALRGGRLRNLTEPRREAWRRRSVGAVDPSDTVVYPAFPEARWTITVFTDVDCVHCRRLHAAVGELNRAGVEVRYMAYPRAGVESRTYAAMVSAWCSKDRGAALTQLKLGEPIPERVCENPVADQYALGGQLGLTGTPGIVTGAGKLIRGFESTDELLAALRQSS